MRTLGCDDARSLLSDALAGEIARPDANLLEAHLQDCAACREQALTLAWQDRVIAELSAQSRIEATLSRVRARIAGLPQEAFEEPRPEPVSKFRRPLWAAAAAAALLLAFAGAFLWRPSPPPSGGLVVRPAVKDAPRPPAPPEPVIGGPVEIRPLPDRLVELPKVEDPRVEAVKKTPAAAVPAPVPPPKLAIQPPDPPVIPVPVPVPVPVKPV